MGKGSVGRCSFVGGGGYTLRWLDRDGPPVQADFSTKKQVRKSLEEGKNGFIGKTTANFYNRKGRFLSEQADFRGETLG